MVVYTKIFLLELKIFLMSYNSLLIILHDLFLKKLFVFEGRANRKEFIIFHITCIFLCILIGILEYLAVKFFGDIKGIIVILGLVNFLISFSVIAITIRRLHDLNISGWGYLFFNCCFCILTIYLMVKDGAIGLKKEDLELSTASNILLWSIIILEYLVLTFIKGASYPNRYDVIKISYIKRFLYIIVAFLVMFLTLFLSTTLIFSSVDKFSALAFQNYKKGNYKDSLKDYNLAIEFTPNNCELYTKRGLVLVKLNQLEEAVNDFDKAIKLSLYKNQNSPIHYLCRKASYKKKIELLIQKSNYNEALAVCDLLFTVFNPDDYILLYMYKAGILNKIKKYDEALENIEKALSINAQLRPALDMKNKILENIKQNIPNANKY